MLKIKFIQDFRRLPEHINKREDMNLSIMSATKVHAAYALIALCALIAAPFALVQAGTLTVNKEIQGTSTVPFTDFSFTINGASTTQFDADGNNDVVLDAGTYIIEEVPVSGYTTTYTDCDSVALTATSTATCTITNTATSTSTSTPTTTPATGTILVEKVVVGGSETAAAFSVTLNGGATTTFDGSGEVVFGDLATGTYSVSEVPFANYTPTYSNCMNITVNSGATTTCTVTNTFNVGDRKSVV